MDNIITETYSGYNTTTTIATNIVSVRPWTPEYVIWYFRLIVFGILGQGMAILGVTTNTINIIIFIKLGVRKDSMNVSLLALSISNFFSCFTVIFLNLCMTPGFTERQDLPFVPQAIHSMFSSYPHITFVKITCCITAFITIERCLCVTYPLKVEQLFTNKRVALIISSMYIFIFILVAPVYYVVQMDWVFFPSRNRTLYTLVFHEDREEVESIVIMFFGVIIPFVTFFATIISTMILVHNLRKNAKWRSSVTAASTNTDKSTNPSKTPNTPDNSSLSTRDARVVKMVAVISSLFIACNGPITILAIAVLFVPEMSVGGTYENTMIVAFSINCLSESINASLNIFIYYTMSTNYKTMLQHVFSINKKL